MFWVSCCCWALCKAMTIWFVSGILQKFPLGHVRDATRVVRSVWGLNPQTAFSVIHISTCCAPRTNVLALVLSTTTKTRTTTSVRDATLPAKLVKVKAYFPLWPKRVIKTPAKDYQNTCHLFGFFVGLGLFFFFTLCSEIWKHLTKTHTTYSATNLSVT